MKIHEQRMINISDIKPYQNNARTHSTQQIEQIVKSIKEFGFTNPLLIDNDCNLIAGHGRLEAIRWLNNFDYKDKPITQLPAVIVSDLSDTQRRALVIADNKIALNAGWDLDILKDELELLENENYDIDYEEGEKKQFTTTENIQDTTQKTYKIVGIMKRLSRENYS